MLKYVLSLSPLDEIKFEINYYLWRSHYFELNILRMSQFVQNIIVLLGFWCADEKLLKLANEATVLQRRKISRKTYSLSCIFHFLAVIECSLADADLSSPSLSLSLWPWLQCDEICKNACAFTIDSGEAGEDKEVEAQKRIKDVLQRTMVLPCRHYP